MAVICVYNYPGEPRQYLFGYAGDTCGDPAVAAAGYHLAYSYFPSGGYPPLTMAQVNDLFVATLLLWATCFMLRFIRKLVPTGV